MSPIAAGPSAPLLVAEVARLPPSALLAEAGALGVYAAPASSIPLVLQEIGRQRELAFREVGEGTGREVDLDAFDLHYVQVFCFDQEVGAVLGGYRLTPIAPVVEARGPAGLYTFSLFQYDRGFLAGLEDGVELGRSFVRVEAWRSAAVLPLLWRGIGAWLAARPGLRRLLGAVSIDARYTPTSIARMIGFLRANHMIDSPVALARSRTPWLPDGPDTARAYAEGALEWDLAALSRRIEQDEGRGVPVLVRQYLKLGARVLETNVDPHFSHVVDALVLVDLARVEPARLARFMGSEAARRLYGADAA